jgi:hypothetical protein
MAILGEAVGSRAMVTVEEQDIVTAADDILHRRGPTPTLETVYTPISS